MVSNLKKFIVIFYSLVFMAFTTGDSKSYYSIPISPMTIAISDFDLDLDNDIVFGHNYSSQINWGGASILNNVGYGYFQLADSLFVDNGYPNVNIGYFDNNDYPDIFSHHVIASPYTVYTGIVFNYGQYQFDSLISFVINLDYPANYLCSGNIDNVNNDDIVFASYQENKWGFLLNDGQGNFSPPSYHNLNFNPTDIKSGKLNEDNYDDIAIGGAFFTIKFSQGNTFQTLSFDTGVADIEITDLDNDGDNDIIGFDNLYFGTEVTFFENTGNSTFYQHENWDFTPGCYHLTVSDFNNDSLPDLFFHTNADNGMYFFYNLGGFEFDSPEFFPFANYGESSRKSASADFDNNGYNDLVIVRSHGTQLPVGNVTILFNDGQGNFLEDPLTEIKETLSNEYISVSCYPNPFTDNIFIDFNVPELGIIKLSIYDISGKSLIYPIEKRLESLADTYIWNGFNKNNQKIQPGIYFIEIILNNYQKQVIKTIKI